MSVRDMQFPSLGQKDPLEKEMATHSSILYMGLSRQEYLPPSHLDATHSSFLAWKIPWTEELGRLQSMGSQRVRHESVAEQ